MFSLSFWEARSAASPPSATPRDAQAPPPIGAVAVSPLTTSTASGSMPSSWATICVSPVAGALALIGDAGFAADAAVRLQRQPAGLVRGNANLHRAVQRRADRGLLDVHGKPDAAVDAALALLGLLPAEPIVVHQRQQPVMAAIERKLTEHDAADGLGVRLRGFGVVAATKSRQDRCRVCARRGPEAARSPSWPSDGRRRAARRSAACSGNSRAPGRENSAAGTAAADMWTACKPSPTLPRG